MESIIEGGYKVVIVNNGALLKVFDQVGTEICALRPPEYSSFYQFAKHAIHGECPIISFEPAHSVNGWQDWYFKIDVQSKSISRLNPWR